jgi:signal transduction histidine kinase
MRDTSSARSPTGFLLAGLAITLTAVGLYSGYTIRQLQGLRHLQVDTIDRNRLDSLLLLRIQNDLNALALAMRDMLDRTEPYPLIAWQGQFQRIRGDLEDALSRETGLSAVSRSVDQRAYLANSFLQFWDAVDRVFRLAQTHHEAEARSQIQLSLQARQSSLATAVARLLIENNENEKQVSGQTAGIYAREEQNVYFFLGAMLLVVLATGLYLIYYNRAMFRRLASLAAQRSELAQQLIAVQESTFSYISRELHDDFGQILTAMGAMLQRVYARASALEGTLRDDLEEVRGIAQSTLEKVRALSQALHPALLDQAGLEAALKAHLPAFQRQTQIEIGYQVEGSRRAIDSRVGIHVYRVLQEALNNVARHSQSKHAEVRLRYLTDAIILEVEDEGEGFEGTRKARGMGLISMQERAELVKGQLELLPGRAGGTLVRLAVPLGPEEADA